MKDTNPATPARDAAWCPQRTDEESPESNRNDGPHRSGCTVCGAELIYSDTDRHSSCCYCGKVSPANARCANGHFVCDHCHSADAVGIIKSVCLHSLEADPVVLMQTIRSHPSFPVNGPEHHAMVPAVILTALRNCGYPATYEQFASSIQRGQSIAGGSCAFLGACGAAIGVGVAVSLLLGATPFDGDKRQMAQQATQAVLGRISSFKAPRCCQRDCWLALNEASALIRRHTGILLAADPFACEQHLENKECIQGQCPLWPENH